MSDSIAATYTATDPYAHLIGVCHDPNHRGCSRAIMRGAGGTLHMMGVYTEDEVSEAGVDRSVTNTPWATPITVLSQDWMQVRFEGKHGTNGNRHETLKAHVSRSNGTVILSWEDDNVWTKTDGPLCDCRDGGNGSVGVCACGGAVRCRNGAVCTCAGGGGSSSELWGGRV